jgi:hypothetical protein
VNDFFHVEMQHSLCNVQNEDLSHLFTDWGRRLQQVQKAFFFFFERGSATKWAGKKKPLFACSLPSSFHVFSDQANGVLADSKQHHNIEVISHSERSEKKRRKAFC